ncbi:MAG: hypothetical protein OZSIB_2375 [Candidatus Ozemobacter sibiricus]|uniref:Uncharacterized protein n=1 Tax=Candidatus Ozemobacter sibiricus TaxID=2268124 RepID=A0A367ZS99_9BACT|nr:MAG: hypothetical protein OZSIB_2375 [Candidatus Ozemobacter sibiricus]
MVPVMILAVVLAGTSSCAGITPEEVFQDGRRAFALGHWREAREHFDRFTHSWPDHGLAVEAQLLAALSAFRSRPQDRDQEEADHLSRLTARYQALKDKVSASELTELAVAVEEPALRQKAASASQLLQLAPPALNHLLQRGLIPEPSTDPIGTLQWIQSWKKTHEAASPATLRGMLDLWQARALWAIRLSPLAAEAHAERLRQLGCWPLDSALARFVRSAFQQGNPDVKRQAALLGISALGGDARRHRKGRPGPSEYLAYLRERGTFFEEAWCPR